MSINEKFAATASSRIENYNPLKLTDQQEIIRLHEITDKELFKYIVLTYFNSCTDYKQIRFDSISVDTIMRELVIDPEDLTSDYKDHEAFFVQLGEADPIDNRGITFKVLPKGTPPSATAAPTPYYSVTFFISLMEYYKNQIINNALEFSWGKRLSISGKLYPTIVFKVRTAEDIFLYDYSSEDPKIFMTPQEPK